MKLTHKNPKTGQKWTFKLKIRKAKFPSGVVNFSNPLKQDKTTIFCTELIDNYKICNLCKFEHSKTDRSAKKFTLKFLDFFSGVVTFFVRQ